jgi:hypothetical protein
LKERAMTTPPKGTPMVDPIMSDARAMEPALEP